MIVIGLTGSIGMGKSAAGRLFRRMGIPVHESDTAVHKALNPRGPAFEEVAVTFPEAWDVKKRLIDRKRLGEIVFHDTHKRQELEKILHPVAHRSQVKFIRTVARSGKKFAVLDIPLLFETGAKKRVDAIVCVTAPHSIQRRRVLRRPGMTEEKFQKILSLQIPDGKKRQLSDFIVQTGLGYAHTYKTLRAIIRKLGRRR